MLALMFTVKSWTSPSGNQCAATLTIDRGGDSIGIAFSWASPPSAEDRDFHYEVLSEALELVQARLSERKAFHDACLELWAEGKIVPMATVEHGERRWSTTGAMGKGQGY